MKIASCGPRYPLMMFSTLFGLELHTWTPSKKKLIFPMLNSISLTLPFWNPVNWRIWRLDLGRLIQALISLLHPSPEPPFYYWKEPSNSCMYSRSFQVYKNLQHSTGTYLPAISTPYCLTCTYYLHGVWGVCMQLWVVMVVVTFPPPLLPQHVHLSPLSPPSPIMLLCTSRGLRRFL